jgi:hypothetical protein
MSYSTAQKNVAAAALCHELPGMHSDVARAWVTCEQGANNNVFGLTHADGTLMVFPSITAGVKAAAAHLKADPLYAPIIASLKGSAQQQAHAIVHSPWHLGPDGLAKTGGIDPYYARIFRDCGVPA